MLICSSFVVASTEIATLNYFGLTFTPTNIIASRFDANDVIEIMRYPTSTQYLLFYRNTIQNIGKDEDIYESRKFHETKEYNATVSLFRNAIAPVTHNLHNKLGLKPIYASLYLSSIFHSNVVSAAADAILPAWEEGIETRYGTHRGAALYDYHFLEGKHIRPAPEECDGYCPESLVLLLEYEEEYLYVWLIVVDPEINSYFTQAKEICVECGEGTRKVSRESPPCNAHMASCVDWDSRLIASSISSEYLISFANLSAITCRLTTNRMISGQLSSREKPVSRAFPSWGRLRLTLLVRMR